MKVLILGAKGMLGQALAEIFFDHELLLWDREEIDITDFANSEKKILSEKPQVIINCAAFTDVDACETKKMAAYVLNGEALSHLATVANNLQATLVQYSTVYVFDGKEKRGYKEDASPAPLSVYGQSKLQGERAAAMADKHYILRLDRLFGKAGAGKKSFVDKMIELAQTQKLIKVIDDEYGCPTYASDLAKLTKHIIEQNKPYGIYHSQNEGSCSWFDWAREIFKIAEIDVELQTSKSSDFKRLAKRPKYGILVNTKLPLQRTWQKALEEYLVGS